MTRTSLFFEQPAWYVLIGILVAFIFAWLLYFFRPQSSWGKRVQYILAFFRWCCVFIVCLLLLAPFLRRNITLFEKPIFILAIDNSNSLYVSGNQETLSNFYSQFGKMKLDLEKAGYVIKTRFLAGQGLQDTVSKSNLDGLLQGIKIAYEGQNLAGVALLSDGIVNQGFSPQFRNYAYPIHTLAAGDTLDREDVKIHAVTHNKLAYQGNRFPLEVEIENYGFQNQDISVSILKNRQIVSRKLILLGSKSGLQKVQFELDANEAGNQHYQIQIEHLEGEFTYQNNSEDFFIEIIDSKEKILLVAAAPHPDINAIRQAIIKNKNYDIQIKILSRKEGQSLQRIKEDYGLIILHHLPNRNFRANRLEQLIPATIPKLFFVGENTYLPDFNRLSKGLDIQSIRGQTDEVFPTYNPDFSLFQLPSRYQASIQKYPPVIVPFGKIQSTIGTEILVHQTVGKINTGKPLIALGDYQGYREAVILGEGIWKWRLDEFIQHDYFEGFDQLISKIIQYTSSKEDKRKFRVYPVQSTFSTSENIAFETEVYDDLYELSYGHEIQLGISSEDGEECFFRMNKPQEGNLILFLI